jgi:phosphatidylglycerophosphatase A
MAPRNRSLADRLTLFVAHGFGTGWIPVAPGTFGTLVGFAWIYLLLIPQNLFVYIGGTIAGFFGAVWIGGRAERLLKIKDPGSIVIDEIAAMPVAFVAPLLFAKGAWTPEFGYYLGRKYWLLPVLAFGFFRIFDVTKPLFIARSQNLKAGWGLVIDDFLAALLAAVCLWIYALVRGG